MAKIDRLPDLPRYCGIITRSRDIPDKNLIDIKVQIGGSKGYIFQAPIFGDNRFEIYKRITNREYKLDDLENEYALCSKKITDKGKDILSISSVSDDNSRENYIKEWKEVNKYLKRS